MKEIPDPVPLTVLYRDEHFIAIDKPPGLLVHRSFLASEAAEFAMQRLRQQIKRRVYPVHRLDRPTSGVLLFALSSAAARAGCALFEQRRVQKQYLAVVRGWCEPAGEIDYSLAEEDDGRAPQPACTRYQRLATVELPVGLGRYATSRYSLVAISPTTGRKHQIRKHFHHIFHPLIGDTTYGEGRHNRLFRERYGVTRLLLMAQRLCFIQPLSGVPLSISASLDRDWLQLVQAFGWQEALELAPEQLVEGMALKPETF